MRSILRRINSAHALAMIALFVAIGGTAGAASVKLITGKNIAKNTVTGANIKNGSVGAADLSSSAISRLSGARGATGATGAKGDTGATGAKGDTGAQGPAAVAEIYSGTGATISPYVNDAVIVSATAGGPGFYQALVKGSVKNTDEAGGLDCSFWVGLEHFDVPPEFYVGDGQVTPQTITSAQSSLIQTTSSNAPVQFRCSKSNANSEFETFGFTLKLVKVAGT